MANLPTAVKTIMVVVCLGLVAGFFLWLRPRGTNSSKLQIRNLANKLYLPDSQLSHDNRGSRNSELSKRVQDKDANIVKNPNQDDLDRASSIDSSIKKLLDSRTTVDEKIKIFKSFEPQTYKEKLAYLSLIEFFANGKFGISDFNQAFSELINLDSKDLTRYEGVVEGMSKNDASSVGGAYTHYSYPLMVALTKLVREKHCLVAGIVPEFYVGLKNYTACLLEAKAFELTDEAKNTIHEGPQFLDLNGLLHATNFDKNTKIDYFQKTLYKMSFKDFTYLKTEIIPFLMNGNNKVNKEKITTLIEKLDLSYGAGLFLKLYVLDHEIVKEATSEFYQELIKLLIKVEVDRTTK